MEWLYPRRRGPEWKQGWTAQTLASISSPPPALLTIFGIVMILLWVSHSTGYEAQLQSTAARSQLFLILLPILLILVIAAYSSSGGYSFRFRLPRGGSAQRGQDGGGNGIPWGIAMLLVVLLLLLSYQSSFHSKWFGGR